MIAEEGGNFELKPWAWRSYAEKRRQALYAFDESALKAHLKLENVIEAAFHVAHRLFGLSFKARNDIDLPHPDARISLSPLALVAEGRTLIGSYLGSAVPARDIPRFVEMWRDGRLPVEALVSSTIGLDQINEGMDELADGHAVRQVIEF